MKVMIGRLRVEAHLHSPRRGNCGDCHWWHLQWDNPGERRGHCRRMAPLTDHSGRTLFPRTLDHQYCGQFQQRTEQSQPAPDLTGGAK